MPRTASCLAFVGAVLWGSLSLAHFLLTPSTGATRIAVTPAKSATIAAHAFRASNTRQSDEQAATKIAAASEPVANTLLAAKLADEPERFAPAPPVEPGKAKLSRQAALAPATPKSALETVSIVGVATAEEIAAARAKSAAGRKAAKIAKTKARARNVQVARHRVAPERVASNQQDQFYYGQHANQPRQAPYQSAFASQQGYGAFAVPSVASQSPKMTDRKIRIATKAKAKKERLARVAGKRYAPNQQQQYRFGQQSQAMPQVSAFAPQRTYGPFSRSW